MKMQIPFCGDCGVNIAEVDDDEAFKGLLVVQAGTLGGEDELEEAAPQAELYVKDRVKWLPALGRVGQMQKFS